MELLAKNGLLEKQVSVPLWGLFNLTATKNDSEKELLKKQVSVPLWGLFNLTGVKTVNIGTNVNTKFPSPYGDYLI